MALTIVTKFLPATVSRGDRIKVSCSNGWTKTYGYVYSDKDNHAVAIWKFLNEKFDTPLPSTYYLSDESYILPMAGLKMDNTGKWYTNSQTINNCGRVVIVDYMNYDKWANLKASYLL